MIIKSINIHAAEGKHQADNLPAGTTFLKGVRFHKQLRQYELFYVDTLKAAGDFRGRHQVSFEIWAMTTGGAVDDRAEYVGSVYDSNKKEMMHIFERRIS